MAEEKKTTTVAKPVAKKAEEKPVVEAVKEEVKAVKAEAKAVKAEVEKKAASAAKKAAAKKPAAKKTAAKKTAAKPAEKKAAPKKEAAKAEVKESITVQFAGNECTTQRLVEDTKNIWVYDFGRDIADFKSVELYVKPDENQVYYVINDGEVQGGFQLF